MFLNLPESLQMQGFIPGYCRICHRFYHFLRCEIKLRWFCPEPVLTVDELRYVRSDNEANSGTGIFAIKGESAVEWLPTKLYSQHAHFLLSWFSPNPNTSITYCKILYKTWNYSVFFGQLRRCQLALNLEIKSKFWNAYQSHISA